MSPDQKFHDFLMQWAADNGCDFEIETYDGHEGFVDGMELSDVWGWLTPTDKAKSDDDYGCVEWSITEEKVILSWNAYQDTV